ncbi:DUF5667 domain-containing protein [Chloroflexota bacterium]
MKADMEFDNILNECMERLLVKGETIEQCLASYPEQASELEPLLQTALEAKNALTIQPRLEFKARARYEFRSAIQAAKTKRSHRFFGWQPRWVTAVAIVLALLLAGGGTATAAGNSMPDEPLYQMKLVTEQVRIRLTPSELDKAQLYAHFADKRVLEIAHMAEEGRPELVERTAQRLDTHLMMIVSLASAQKHGPEIMMAPPSVRAPGRPEQAGDEPIPPKEVNRRAKLRLAMAHYATHHPDILRAALNKTPESARPALLYAIAISVAGYEKALEAMESGE